MEFLTNLDNYNIFYEVAKTKNLTKASEKLFISQPAVTQAIKKLENNLGVILFIRSTKGMELTEIGKKIFNNVEIGLKSFANINEIINEEKGLINGNLIIGSGSNIFRRVLGDVTACFICDYPNINLKLIENTQFNMIEGLKNGEVGLVLTQFNKEIDFDFIPLFETEYCFVKSTNCDCEKFITNNEGTYTKLMFDEFIKEMKLDCQPIQVTGYKNAIDLVLRGVGITLTPIYLVEDYIKENKLQIVYKDYTLPKITFGIYYNKSLLTPAIKKYLEYLN